MSNARERLSRLIELASENTPEKHRALAFELCDLLGDWPERYPPTMREPFEALLEKVLQRLDEATRRVIIAHLARNPEMAPALLFEFFLDMPQETRKEILQRNCASVDVSVSANAAEEISLIDTARNARAADFPAVFARFLSIPPETARRIVEDTSGNALAVSCKAARVRRATYSALALLVTDDCPPNPDARYARLALFEEIPEEGAYRLLAHWRRPAERLQIAEPDVHAA